MIPARPSDARHKAQLLQLLKRIADNAFLAQNLYFKGGTCASMLSFLDRFSVDLDFDLNPKASVNKIRQNLEEIFTELDLSIKDQSRKVPEYFLGYAAPKNERNTLKVDAFGPVFKANIYEAQFLPEIDRTLNCQTIETMFANKIVAPLDRFKKHEGIAGRDFYDLHHFFENGYRYEPAIITERTGDKPEDHLEKLTKFIKKYLTQTVLDQDLNTLLPYEIFKKIRGSLKEDLLVFLNDEITRL